MILFAKSLFYYRTFLQLSCGRFGVLGCSLNALGRCSLGLTGVSHKIAG